MKLEISEDLETIQETIWKEFGLKQVLSILAALIIGGGFFYIVYQHFHPLICAYLTIPVAAPIILAGFFYKDGMNAGEYIKKMIGVLLFPKWILYQSTEEEFITPKLTSEKKGEIMKKDVRIESKKKNGLILFDKLAQYKRPDGYLYDTPKSVQQTIDIAGIAENGIFKLPGNRFSKVYLFADVNYMAEKEDERLDILDEYCKFLSSMNVSFKISIVNRDKREEREDETLLFKDRNDGFDSYRRIYLELIEEKREEGRGGIEQKRYITVAGNQKNYEEAKVFFNNLEAVILSIFQSLGTGLLPLNATERLCLLYELHHMYENGEFEFDFRDFLKAKKDYKNEICNRMMRYNADTIDQDETLTQVLFVKRYPKGLEDSFMNALASLPYKMVITTDVVPISEEDAVDIVDAKYMGIERSIRRQQNARNKNNDFASDISYKKQQEKEVIHDMIEDIAKNDQALFVVTVFIVLYANDKDELASKAESVVMVGERYGCSVETCFMQQRESYNTALPIGNRHTKYGRSMMTKSLAALHPFNVQELYIPGKESFFYGLNAVSKNLIAGNRKMLPNGNGWVFGDTGFGKSFWVNMEIGQVFLNTDDDIIMIDPHNEYFNVAERYGGNIVNISTKTNTHLNPLYIPANVGNIEEAVAEKSEFMLAFCEECKKSPLGSRERSVIDRVVGLVFKDFSKNRKERTLRDFYEILKQQPEIEADDIAVTMELYVTGSYNLFSYPSNIKDDSRFTVYGLKDLGNALFGTGTMTMMEKISERLEYNFKRGIATRIYFDEASVMLKRPCTAQFMLAFWVRVRKFGGILTGILQNVGKVLDSSEFESLIGNSAFLVFLHQDDLDCKRLSEKLHISESKLTYISGAKPGVGLLKYGNHLLQFNMEVDKENELYAMYNTNFHEKNRAIS